MDISPTHFINFIVAIKDYIQIKKRSQTTKIESALKNCQKFPQWKKLKESDQNLLCSFDMNNVKEVGILVADIINEFETEAKFFLGLKNYISIIVGRLETGSPFDEDSIVLLSFSLEQMKNCHYIWNVMPQPYQQSLETFDPIKMEKQGPQLNFEEVIDWALKAAKFYKWY